ncbi:hypothetical protein JCM6882_007856 [Rhodosporidiobolus microsporus]
MPWVPTPSDGLPDTPTLREQYDAEQSISSLLTSHISSGASALLQKDQHTSFLTRFLRQPLPPMFTGLDASRPWLLYWTVHSLALFEGELDSASKKRVVETLKACQNEDGGFGGGPGQLSHLAPSYAATCALAYVGEEGWKAIDRPGMYRFLLSLKQPDGSFIMHDGGEVDVRGCYCALTIATLLNLLTPDLATSTSSFIASCQTYEGGLASSAQPFPSSSAATAPLGEAHGGYTFCAAASYSMLSPFRPSSSLAPSSSARELAPSARRSLDLPALLRWSTSMQASPIEGGGFRGRTNKLVDGCYGWWCGGLGAVVGGLLAEERGEEEEGEEEEEVDVYDRSALQQYILLIAQSPTTGGLRDKPGKPADAYHTCYNLSGASTAQSGMRFSHALLRSLEDRWVQGGATVVEEEGGEAQGQGKVEVVKGANESDAEARERMKTIWSRALAWTESERGRIVYGEEGENALLPNHPLFNIVSSQVEQTMAFFYGQD